jgi:precorrin-3B synthase
MLSGDGWLVRLRPPAAGLSPAQAAGVAEAARRHGNGILDLSARANLQLRGVRADGHAALIGDLRALGLIDPDPAAETARSIVVTPFADAAALALAEALAGALTGALTDAPALPDKFGFAIDTGPRPVLTGTSADIRLERAASGDLLLRADGHALGRAVAPDAAAKAAIDLARWFLAKGGAPQARGRMAALVAAGHAPPGADTAPALPVPVPAPGLHPAGALVGIAFGQMTADLLEALAALGHDLRLTPWRMLLLAGASALPAIDGLLTDPADPLRRVTACTGAPGCAQAQGATRELARALAPDLPTGAHLHVSGCAKGCAHPGPASWTLVAGPEGFDLIRDGRAGDAPDRRAIPPGQLSQILRGTHVPSL